MEEGGSIIRECLKKDLGGEESQTERERQESLACRKKVKNAFVLAIRFVLTSKSPWIALRRCLNEVM